MDLYQSIIQVMTQIADIAGICLQDQSCIPMVKQCLVAKWYRFRMASKFQTLKCTKLGHHYSSKLDFGCLVSKRLSDRLDFKCHLNSGREYSKCFVIKWPKHSNSEWTLKCLVFRRIQFQGVQYSDPLCNLITKLVWYSDPACTSKWK